MSEVKMTREQELRSQMAELQQKYSAIKTEVDDLVEIRRREESHRKFADFKFKVGCFGAKLYPQEKIEEVTDRDREEAVVGATGIAYTNSETTDGYYALMLREKGDYDRFAKLLKMLDAAKQISTEGAKNKKHYVKVLLGETTEELPDQQ